MNAQPNNWQDLAATSHYLTAVAVADALREGEIEEAHRGIEELVEALSRTEKLSARSFLLRIMTHVIKWKYQPEKRTISWVISINDSRNNIEAIKEDTSSVTDNYLKEVWDKTFQRAVKGATLEMGMKNLNVELLTWNEVFEQDFSL